MSPVVSWVRIDVRQRGRSMAVLAALVAIAAATVLTAVAGARRGASAVDRLGDRTRPADLAVLPNESGFDWDAVRAIPGVETVVEFALAGYQVEGLPDDAIDFPYLGDELFRDLERPVVLDGRLPDPDRPDEAVVTPAFTRSFGFGVGDTVALHLYSAEQVVDGATDGSAPAEGPRIPTTIVGVVRSPWFADAADATGGRLIPSTGLIASYPDSFLGGPTSYLNALVRLDGGAAAVGRFHEQLAAVTGRTDIEVFDRAEDAAHARRVTGFEARSLGAFAAAAAVASLFLIGQSVSRYASAAAADLEVMRALGMSPRHRRIAAAIEPAASAVAGAVVGVGLAFALSGRFPVGTAAAFEPNPGRRLDLVVLAPGLIGVPVLVTLGALASAWNASRRQVSPSPRASSVAAAAANLGTAVPVSIGARFALEPGSGSRSVPVRPALAGAVIGVLGVVAALIVSAGVDDAASNPARFGQSAAIGGFLGFNGEDFVPADPVLDALAADPDVAAVNDSRQAVGEVGDVDLAVYAFDPVGAELPIVLLRGDPPGETGIVVAPTSADRLGVGVGDTLDLGGTATNRVLTVTGIGFVTAGPHNDSADGAWVGATAYDELFDGFFKFHMIDVALVGGADPEDVAERLGPAITAALGDPDIDGSEMLEVRPPPPALAELRQVERLPLLLAAFLAVLAVGAVGHALATAVRRRRHDLAVLRSIGLTRAQCRWIVVVQASLLAAVGLAFGVPLGLATGRTVWRTVADNTPIQYVPPTAVAVLVLVGPVALVVANLLAAWPSQRAATIRVGHALRTE